MKSCSNCNTKITSGSKTGLCIKCSRAAFPVWNTGYKEKRVEVIRKLSNAKKGKTAHNKGSKMSLEQKIKISCTAQGINITDFNTLKTEESKAERNKMAELKLHKSRFEIDSYTCQCCCEFGGKLNAHHLNSWKFFPEQRLDINNLITLCKNCHQAFHRKYRNGKKSPNTTEQFNIFKKEIGQPV